MPPHTYQIIVDGPHCSLGGVVLVLPGGLVHVPGTAVDQDGHRATWKSTLIFDPKARENNRNSSLTYVYPTRCVSWNRDLDAPVLHHLVGRAIAHSKQACQDKCPHNISWHCCFTLNDCIIISCNRCLCVRLVGRDKWCVQTSLFSVSKAVM